MNTYPEMNEYIKDLLKMNTESNVHQYAYQRIIELEKKVTQYEKALCAILTMAYEDDCDEIVDIITDSITGFVLNEQYEKYAIEGKKSVERFFE